jgi:hypothetical protein
MKASTRKWLASSALLVAILVSVVLAIALLSYLVLD